MKKKKEKQQKKVENKLVDIMNNDSMKLFSMLSLYFFIVDLIISYFSQENKLTSSLTLSFLSYLTFLVIHFQLEVTSF